MTELLPQVIFVTSIWFTGLVMGASIVSYRWRRSLTLTLEPKPTCGCGHHLSYHNEKGCHFTDYFTECGCVKYIGPEALPEYYS